MTGEIPMPAIIAPQTIELYAEEVIEFEIEEVIDTGTTQLRDDYGITDQTCGPLILT